MGFVALNRTLKLGFFRILSSQKDVQWGRNDDTVKQISESSNQALIKIRQDLAGFAGSEPQVVFVSGNFNILHPGHLRLLRFAAECGDYLVVGVNDDQHAHVSAVIPERLRLDGLLAVSFVNHAFILRENPEEFIRALKPAIVVKGKEHEAQTNPELEAVQAHGGKLIFGSGDITFSSVDLLQQEFQKPQISTIQTPKDYPERHGFKKADLLKVLDRFRELRVTVVGDLIVDDYITCDALGMSQEDPTLVVSPVHQDRFIGGAGIVAAHARGLGAQVRYFGVCGKDDAAAFARQQLTHFGVDARLWEDDSRPTTLKQRYRASSKTLLRVNHLRHHDISNEINRAIFDELLTTLDRTDLLIFSDFNYGCLPDALVKKISDLAVEKNIRMVADSQSSSQVGDVSRFKNMLLITPTEREARLAMRDFNSGLVVLAESLRKRAKASNVIMTLGAEGLLIHAQLSSEQKMLTDRLPAFNPTPRDVAGAGDSFLTSTSLAMVVGASIWESSYLGSIAAACQVGRLGNLPLTVNDIRQELLRESN